MDFIVLVCVLVIGALAVAYIIRTCWRQARRPDTELPSCAGYFLVYSDEETSANNNQQLQGFQLSVLTT